MDKLDKSAQKFSEQVFNITYMCVHAQSCLALCDPVDYSQPGSSVHGSFPDKNIGVGCYFFLQGISLTQGLNPCLLHCRWILYLVIHQGSP